MSQAKDDLGDPGGGTADNVNGEANAFARSGIMGRSPVSSQNIGVSKSITTDAQEEQSGLGLAVLFTPKANSSNIQADQKNRQFGRTTDVRKMVEELYEFIKEKHNVHHKIRALVTGIKSGMLALERDQAAWKARAEKAEKQLKDLPLQTPKSGRTGKRDRDTPGDEEASKKQKEDEDEENKNVGESSGWHIVQNKAEKKIEKKKKEEKKNEERKKEEKKKDEIREVKKTEQKNPLQRRERIKGDALVVSVKEGGTYAELLRKVRADPQLKELGENVVRTRRTQRGEMLFELKKDPAVKSSAFKQLVEKSLGEEAEVRALSQETVVECRNLDEITTVDELQRALKDQCGLEEGVTMVIRMRKAYGGTQTASIRLSMAVANKVLETGKVKVGWSVCPLKITPRVTKQMERCFKCMGFGHLA